MKPIFVLLRPRPVLALFFLTSLVLPAFAAAQTTPPPAADDDFDEYATPKVSDPFEGFNRSMFAFNEKAYHYVLRPISHGYTAITPKPVRRGLSNFFDNIRFPVRFVGSVLQGKGRRAARETGRFLVNSTLGLGGLLDPADNIKPLAHVPAEDIGQALGAWHIGAGPYLVLPLLGPTSTRDLVGRIGDYALTPTSWKWIDHYDWRVRSGVQTLDTLNALPPTLELYDQFEASALDPYISLRNGYLSYREEAVKR